MNRIKKEKTLLYTIILVAAICVLAVTQVVILNQDSTQGEKLTLLFSNIKSVDDENNRLVQQVASSSALSNLSLKVREKGFTHTPQLVSLGRSLPLAFLDALSR